jgi:hypothetical protein
MVDEMDLLSGMKAAEPVRQGAFEEARAVLRAAMAVQAAPETKTASRRRARWGMRRTAGFGFVAIGAAAAAVTLVVTSAPATRSAAPTASASGAAAASSSLLSLAAFITASSGPLPGNASLIIRTQVDGGRSAQVSYNLYTDSGAFYAGGDKKSLMQAIAEHQNMADGITAREVKAALYAASGNLATAREQMLDAAPNALGLGLPLAAREEIWATAMAAEAKNFKEKGIKAPPLPTGKALQEAADNLVWNDSVDALSAGAGNPRVRAGVLRLLSTISGVSVTKSTTDGQPTLTLTAGPETFDGKGRQVLTINAKTGMPIKSWAGDLGPQVPSSVDSYQVSRVTLAGIEAGRF